MSLACENCGVKFEPDDRVIVLRRVTGLVAPDDPNGYIVTDRTKAGEAIHAKCPEPESGD